MDYKINVRVKTPTGRVATDYEIFSTSGDPEKVAPMMAEILIDELLSDLFDLDFIIDRVLTEEEIRQIEDEEWVAYFTHSDKIWSWEEYKND